VSVPELKYISLVTGPEVNCIEATRIRRPGRCQRRSDGSSLSEIHPTDAECAAIMEASTAHFVDALHHNSRDSGAL